MICTLFACLLVANTNVTFATELDDKKTEVSKSDVPKTEINFVSADTLLLTANYESIDVYVIEKSEFIAAKEALTTVNVFIAPEDVARIRDKRLSNPFSYILKLPEDYLLPNKKTWRYGAYMRC